MLLYEFNCYGESKNKFETEFNPYCKYHIKFKIEYFLEKYTMYIYINNEYKIYKFKDFTNYRDCIRYCKRKIQLIQRVFKNKNCYYKSYITKQKRELIEKGLYY